MAEKKINRELSIFINDREVINSLGGVTREITRVNNEMKNLNKNSATYDDDLKRLKGTLTDLKGKQSAFKDEIHSTTQEMGSASEAFEKIFAGLASGNLNMAKEGFEQVRGSIVGMGKAALAFIATPLGAAIAVLSGIAIGTKAVFDFNAQAEKSSVLIENLTGKTGQAVEDIRVRMQSLTDTFGLTFESLAGAVDNLVDTGAAKDELSALNMIKQGLLTAPDKNEFIASLESTAIAAKNIGAPLEAIIAIKQQIEATGVDPEKTFGALQKSANNLALQTDSLRAKLSSAFGAAFTDEILAKVKTGQITTVQALDLIGKKSKEVGLNQQQQAELGKELFGKAGIAAGGYAMIVGNVVEAEKKRTLALNANQSALSKLDDAYQKLNKAQSELFRVKDFGEIWTNIKANAISALSAILDYIVDLKKNIQPLIDIVAVVFVQAWINLKTGVAVAFDFISGALKIFSNSIGTIISVVSKLLQGDFIGAINSVKQGFINMGNIVGDTFAKIKNTIIDSVKAIVSNIAPVLKAIGINVDGLQKSLDSLKSKNVVLKTKKEETATTKTTATTATQEEVAAQTKVRDDARQKEADSRQKAADKKKADQEKKDKEEKDRLLALAKSQTEVAKAEMDLFLANNKTKIDTAKELTQVLIDEEIKRLESIKQIQLDALQVERDGKITKAEEEGKSAEEIKNLKYAYDLEYQTAKQELEFGFTQSTDALKKTYAEQQKQFALEQLLADNELAIAEADTKAQEDTIRQSQDYKKQIDGYKKLLADKKITQDEYDRFKVSADAKQDEMNRVRELQQLQGTLGGLNQLAGALGEMFGQSKELAIVQAGINGAMAVTKILAETPKEDFGVMTAIMIAAAGVTTLAQIGKITSAKAPKKPKFNDGGYTGSQASLGYDEYGPVTGYVHKNEWVAPESMTQSPRYAATFSWLEGERKNKLKGYFEGGATSSTSLAAPVPGMEQTNQNNELLQAVLFHLQNPKAPTLLFGYKEAQSVNDLNIETQQSINNGIVS